MARDFAEAFYHSKPWRVTRDSYMDEGFGLCERCLSLGKFTKAEIVHHRIHLSPQNINNPEITLGRENLERVCRECHAFYHPEVYGSASSRQPRWTFDDEGNVVPVEGAFHE